MKKKKLTRGQENLGAKGLGVENRRRIRIKFYLQQIKSKIESKKRGEGGSAKTSLESLRELFVTLCTYLSTNYALND